MKNLQVFSRYLLVCGSFTVVFILSSCEKANQKRTYEEVVTLQEQKSDETTSEAIHDPQKLLQEMIARGEDPHASLNLSKSLSPAMAGPDEDVEESPIGWSVPDGWKENPAGGMRLVSFGSDQYPGIDVSIVSLGGMAGGVSANVNRWLAQIHFPSLDEESLNEFLSKQEKFKTESGLLVTLIDLTMLQEKEDNNTEPGILAAMVKIPDRTVFVKMTAMVDEINRNREPFHDLCRSLKVKN